MVVERSVIRSWPRFRALVAASRPGARWFPAVLLGWLILGALLAAVALRHSLPLPFCLLRTLTGIPCPACGCTRSLASWAHFHPDDAFRFNPLFCLACVGLAAWACLGLVDAALGTQRAAPLARLVQRHLSVRRILILAGVNWLYLWLNLPT